MKWYSLTDLEQNPIPKDVSTNDEILAMDRTGELLLGYLDWDEDKKVFICEGEHDIIIDVCYFIPVEELENLPVFGE